MERRCNVTFITHSSFLVETEKSYLLFDYWKGEIPALSEDKTLYVFASHSHHDHYSKEIYALEKKCKEVHYILSSDIKEMDQNWKTVEKVTFMEPYESVLIGDCKIETLKSTDLGVAFMLEIEGLSLYHAGDLHWWEWPGEPEEENEDYIANYKAELERMKGRYFDVAFVVLDPRQDEAGGRGMDAFLSQIGASYVFPMHLWGEYDLIQRYKKENDGKFSDCKIMDIFGKTDSFRIIIEK